MGVMPCTRPGCDAILCEHLILGRRYLCNTCFGELIEAKKGWPEEMTEQELTEAIEAFLDSDARTTKRYSGKELDAAFNRMIGLDRDD